MVMNNLFSSTSSVWSQTGREQNGIDARAVGWRQGAWQRARVVTFSSRELEWGLFNCNLKRRNGALVQWPPVGCSLSTAVVASMPGYEMKVAGGFACSLQEGGMGKQAEGTLTHSEGGISCECTHSQAKLLGRALVLSSDVHVWV